MTSRSAASGTRTVVRPPSRFTTSPSRSTSSTATSPVNDTSLSGIIVFTSARRSPSWLSRPPSITITRGHSATTSSM